jgi:glycosyltransferase involved in cell wall biosynthesis
MIAPEVSIVLSTWSRPAQLKSCLEGIVALDSPRDSFEVVVVDDGSAVSPAPLIDTLRHQLAIRLIALPRNLGPAAARNAGASAARGKFLVFIDDDCVPTPGWLSALVSQLHEHPDCLVGGRVENGLPANPYSVASQNIATYVRECYQAGRSNEHFFGTNTGVYTLRNLVPDVP